MKKLIALLFIAALFMQCSDKKTGSNPNETTVIGLFTPYELMPEIVHKKVKEMKETNFWPLEKDGKIEAGQRLNTTARDTLSWTPDFMVQFDESGLAEKVIHLNENDDPYESWIIKNEASYPVNAIFFVKDSIAGKQEITKINDTSYRWKIINPQTDTLRSSGVMELNENRNYKTFQFYNFKGEPTSKYEWMYNSSGQLTGYTVSRNDTVRMGMNFTFNEKGSWETQEVYSKITGISETNRYEYEYDDAGNWTKAVSFVNEKPFIVALREYTYY
ncbi:MAG: hypothetical protein JW761_07965 [Prolixibacteraceae bacterium]|nr:hypothetical protein [Prolixibacteraceae bacterium]